MHRDVRNRRGVWLIASICAFTAIALVLTMTSASPARAQVPDTPTLEVTETSTVAPTATQTATPVPTTAPTSTPTATSSPTPTPSPTPPPTETPTVTATLPPPLPPLELLELLTPTATATAEATEPAEAASTVVPPQPPAAPYEPDRSPERAAATLPPDKGPIIQEPYTPQPPAADVASDVTPAPVATLRPIRTATGKTPVPPRLSLTPAGVAEGGPASQGRSLPQGALVTIGALLLAAGASWGAYYFLRPPAD